MTHLLSRINQYFHVYFTKVKREAEEKMEAEWQALAKSTQREVSLQDITDQRKRR